MNEKKIINIYLSEVIIVMEVFFAVKILNFGSLNIDYVYKVDHIVKRGETISSESLNVFSGGKGLNQSVALGKAGAEVFHAGAIGEDGRFLTDILKKAGVNTDCVEVLQTVRTGNAIIQNDKDGDNCIILYGGANQAIEKDYIDNLFDKLIIFFKDYCKKYLMENVDDADWNYDEYFINVYNKIVDLKNYWGI